MKTKPEVRVTEDMTKAYSLAAYRSAYQTNKNRDLILTKLNKALKTIAIGEIVEQPEGYVLYNKAEKAVVSDSFKEPEEVLAFILEALTAN